MLLGFRALPALQWRMAIASLCRGIQVVQAVGLAWAAYEMTSAALASARRRTWRPLAVETVGQAGSWAAGVAGMKIGGKLGAAFGLSSGAGALVTATIGAGIGGLAGYVATKRAAAGAGWRTTDPTS
jgi:hypothetical protein